MTKKINRILAIDPGTRNIGVAFFVGKELRYFGVKMIPKLGSKVKELSEGKRIINELIHDFRPNILSVEKNLFKNDRNSDLLNIFSRKILAIGRKRNLKVISVSPNTIRKIVCGNGFASKDEVAKVVAAKYSEIKSYLTSNRKWKEKLYKNMFDAIAVGLASCEKI